MRSIFLHVDAAGELLSGFITFTVITMKTKYLQLSYFQKRTAQITFKRPELVDRLNEIIARHYPGMLAFRQRPA
ncbi:TPA: DUF4942 domain-containing protein [Citrobacter freundii]|jgi:hypothetical protein|nr:DUF4942 domain-containing protein [Citrobacter farmeri]ELM2197297.1 DUF4942 domain-containing protein [Citrobacter freundii]HEM7911291.1 DUF4942 domain-containing protein [Citrobacter koseri]HAU5663369.1 DUF4942 domain-containing protein [Citrobacter freundii]HCB2472370.1 DUF4942 domain-containing protein [Citrobacter freundii]